MSGLSRRDLLKAGVAGAAVTTIGVRSGEAQQNGSTPAQTPEQAAANRDTLFFFNSEEAKFIDAVTERLIPADPQWGGARAAGVLYYIDHQLAGAYGVGDRMYLDGPWDPGAPPEQGYQLKHSPAELYRTGIAEVRRYAGQQHDGGEVWDLKPEDLDKLLTSLETGDARLETVPAPVFFETLLANTIEGYFADPAYGGNRDMVGWKMIGFPGAYAQWVELVDQYNYEVTRPPMGIGEAGDQHMAGQHMAGGHTS